MKSLLYLSVSICLFCGCKNPKQAKTVINAAVKEYKALNNTPGVRYLKYKNRMETVKEWLNTEPSYSLCYKCNGYGVLYLVDDYGYAILDTYGNYILETCHACDGNGYTED